MLRVVMPSVVMLTPLCWQSPFSIAMLSDVMLVVITLVVVMLNVFIQNVVALSEHKNERSPINSAGQNKFT